jgi:hypothetical protein
MYLSVDDGIKNVDIKFNAKTRFWNDIHQARSGITFIRHVLEYPSSGTFWNTLHQARSGIPFIRHVLEYPSSGTFSVKSVGARKPKGIIRIRKIGYGHICLREKILINYL